MALLKELVDNGLDACEMANVVPKIEVTLHEDGFSVLDNGPGLSQEVLIRSLDYIKRVSDKVFYVSPTRGQMGNALKCVWAAPFLLDGEYGRVEVWSQGIHHTVDVSVDRIAQQPAIDHSAEEDDFVKNGTLFRVYLPESASSTEECEMPNFYNVPTPEDLIAGYAAFNPHATFHLDKEYEATDSTWRKWKPNDPTSAHWYTSETLRDLIAGYVAEERYGGRSRTVREFVSEFRGLSSTAKQKSVTGDLSGVYLHDLIEDGDIDLALVERLLKAMQERSKAPKPAALGTIGEAHITNWMVQYAGVSEDSVRYAKRVGSNGLPHIVEIGFGVRNDDSAGRIILTGLNWTPTLGNPVEELSSVIAEMRIDRHDPITVVVHMARPRFEFTDRGKTRLEL